MTFLERYALPVSVVAFAFGVVVTSAAPHVGSSIVNTMDVFLEWYGYVVPVLLYFLLTPSLMRLQELAAKYGNGWLGRVIRQFMVARLFAMLFAIVVLTTVYRLPIYINGTTTFADSLWRAAAQLGATLVGSHFLYGVYAAIFTAAVARRFSILRRPFDVMSVAIERFGEYFIVLSPAFMFTIGSFLTHLPSYLAQNLDPTSASLLATRLLFLREVAAGYEYVALYMFIGLGTGLLCLLWHAAYILYTTFVVPSFRVREYFRGYWVRVYPLLWSSSSEALAVPLSLAMFKRTFPHVPDGVRQFVIAGGSYLGINGTLISVYVMGVTLAVLVGAPISFLHLFFSIPVIFLLGYAVPGIPGELVIFAGTMSVLLNVPEAVAPLFLSLYITLQLGLPDAFRTGCNSTDSALLAITSEAGFERQKHKQQAVTHAPPRSV